jgi:hypothetical protein
MEVRQTQEQMPYPNQQMTGDGLRDVQATMMAHRKRLAQVPVEEQLSEDPEPLLANFKQFPGQ